MSFFRVSTEFGLHLLNLPGGKLGSIQASRDLRIQVSSDKPADRDCGHNPESHPGYPPEFEGRVQGDYQRRRRAHNDMEIEPVPGIALPAEPAPFLAQWVEINQEKQEHAKHAQVYANRATRSQQSVLGRKWPFVRAQHVVIEPIYGECGDKCYRRNPAKGQAPAVPSFQSLRLAENGKK